MFQPKSTYHQAVIIFERITHALVTIGAQLTDVVRVRMFVLVLHRGFIFLLIDLSLVLT